MEDAEMSKKLFTRGIVFIPFLAALIVLVTAPVANAVPPLPPVEREEATYGVSNPMLRTQVMVDNREASQTWYIALDDAPTYWVSVVCGDVAQSSGPNRVLVEGAEVINTRNAPNEFTVAMNHQCTTGGDGDIDIAVGGGAYEAWRDDYPYSCINAVIITTTDPATQSFTPRDISFGPSSQPGLDPSWEIDSGALKGEADPYGWTQDLTANAVNRSEAGVPVELNTFVYAGSGTQCTWNMDLPNGKYYVSLSLGDASGGHDHYSLVVEDNTLADDMSLAIGEFYQVSKEVIYVFDGSLTVKLGGIGFSCLNYIKVNQDEDGDGITNTSEEDTYNTQKDMIDTDGDDISDYDEINDTYGYGTSATNADSDSDGAPDGLEHNIGTNPMLGSDILIVDDKDAGFSTSGSPWYTNVFGGYNDSHSWTPEAGGDGTATWTLSIPYAGYWQIFESHYASASSNAPNTEFTVNYAGGSETIPVNQTSKSMKWIDLGIYYFNVGNYTIVMENVGEGTRLIADAIMAAYINTSPPTTVTVTDESDFVVDSGTFGEAGSYKYANNGDYGGPGPSTGHYNVSLPSSGVWNVYGTWEQDPSHAVNASFTINYEGGSETYYADQTKNGYSWNLLGTYEFNSGTTYEVQVDTSGVEGWMIVDNLKFVKSSGTAPNTILAESVNSLEWQQTQGSWRFNSEFGYGDNGFYYAKDTDGCKADFKFTLPETGSWKLYGYWYPDATHGKNSRFNVNSAGGTETVIQPQTTEGLHWVEMGIFNMPSGLATVEADATVVEGWFIADALKFVKTDEVPVASFYVGNDSWEEFSYTGSWTHLGIWTYHYAAADSGETATWSFNIPSAGYWDVHAQWESDGSHANSAPFVIHYGDGAQQQEVRVDMTGSATGFGNWNYLGTFQFDAGTHTIDLNTNGAGGWVIAQDVRVRQHRF